MTRRTDEEEEITLSALPIGMLMLGFWNKHRAASAVAPPPPPETFFVLMQDGSRVLQQDGSSRIIRNG